jgi:serine/threonine-protein kinase HipA
MAKAKAIFVHVDLQGKTHFVGRCWVHTRKQGKSASFEYSRRWQKSPASFSLEPALKLGEGSFHTPKGKSLFGSIGDSAPDRWGRLLMKRLEARKATEEKRARRLLHDSDYLLMVNDMARQGALRFAEQEGGPFLAEGTDAAIPPIVELGRFLAASDRILENKELDQDIKDLVAPGASLGGARPKASVVNTNGKLMIAKFPSVNDEWDVELWEYIAIKMAAKAGIPTPDVQLEKIGGRSVLLLDRFDRHGAKRIPFLSAMSMLGYSDGDQGSYLEIAEALSQHGASTSEDLRDLWRRIVFNIMISNVDDHLRNHGFLYAGSAGWRLSPIYDLEPTPEHEKQRVLNTFIDLDDGSASLELAYAVTKEFGLTLKDAKAIAKEVATATQTWDKDAALLGVSKNEIELMRSVFDHDDLKLGEGK